MRSLPAMRLTGSQKLTRAPVVAGVIGWSDQQRSPTGADFPCGRSACGCPAAGYTATRTGRRRFYDDTGSRRRCSSRPVVPVGIVRVSAGAAACMRAKPAEAGPCTRLAIAGCCSRAAALR
jgi:hypothetical protein